MFTFEIVNLENTQVGENWNKVPQTQIILPLLALGEIGLIILVTAIASV